MDIEAVISTTLVILGCVAVFGLAAAMVWQEFVYGSRFHLAIRRLFTNRTN